jgi:methylthioribose-1-phosphate isomerase
VPFYYATSYSTIDLSRTGDEIPIEERGVDEVTRFYRLEAKELKERGIISRDGLDGWPPPDLLTEVGKQPKKGEVTIYNPAFDVTPPNLIDTIITDIGCFKPDEIVLLTREKIDNLVRARLLSWGLTLNL